LPVPDEAQGLVPDITHPREDEAGYHGGIPSTVLDCQARSILRIALLYVCVTHGKRTADLALRFVETYHAYPPGLGHDTFIVCNGGPLPSEIGLLFAELRPVFWPRENDPGWDISAFLQAAHSICRGYDMMLCLGESSHFHRFGWLARFEQVWDSRGPGFYGTLGSFRVSPHLQTTVFCTAPWLLKLYPQPVKSKRDRYQFEHGPASCWRALAKRGVPVRLVTWDGDYEPKDWRRPENILFRGNQRNCLVWNNHTDNWAKADPSRRQRWSSCADTHFR
jgi:hypothetical protein